MAEIAIAGLPLDFPHSGTAVYLRNLLSHLPEIAPEHSYRLFLRRAEPVGSMSWGRITTPFDRLGRQRGLWAQADKFLWETVALPLASTLDGCDLVHSPTFSAPAVTRGRLVVTVHDLIPLVLPAYRRTRQSALYSRFMAWRVRRADAIITVSEHSKRDIVRVLDFPADRIHVTYEAAGEDFTPVSGRSDARDVQARYTLPLRYLLYVGGAERRKNIDTLVRAWAHVAAEMRRDEVNLVIVAEFPPPNGLYPDIPGLVRELGLRESVVLVPRVDDVDMPQTYRSALAFCFPSRYEGFGLTPLEAMASGTPVLASNATSIPEVVGDAAILLNPDDIGAWADAMRTIVRSAEDRARLTTRGLARAAEFSWRKTAQETAAVYRGVLG